MGVRISLDDYNFYIQLGRTDLLKGFRSLALMEDYFFMNVETSGHKRAKAV